MSSPETISREKRWRLILGGGEADGLDVDLSKAEIEMDRALEFVYNKDETRSAGRGASTPKVARWLGDIRKYFPSDMVRVIQKDAFERLNMESMLMEPEFLEMVEPDVNMVANLISLGRVIPNRTKETARIVVRKVVYQLLRRLETPMRTAVTGSLDRSARTNRPKHNAIDWNRTIKANLKHYQKDYNTVIPERLIGYARRQRNVMREITLCVDQSGSMANSIVYSSIFSAVMASIPAVKTQLVVFDTEVVDLTEKLDDPVDVLFGVQLGGGTDINRAVAYCQSKMVTPANNIFVLISDLYEGGVRPELIKRVASMIASGVTVIVLLALSDEGAPCYDAALATELTALGAPSFACTPDLFPELMAAAIQKRDIQQWAGEHDLYTKGSEVH